MSLVALYEIDGEIKTSLEVYTIALNKGILLVGTSSHALENGNSVITYHYQTRAGGVTSLTRPTPIEYKQRFNKKVAMA